MKKIIALVILAATLCCALVGCSSVDPNLKSEGVMTYAEYDAAAMDSEVTIEAFVQATQSWWSDKITVYLQDGEGAYFCYEMKCSKDDAAKLTPGTKIQVKGYKGAYKGEIEIMDATFTFVDTTDTWIAKPTDVTAVLANEDELVKHQNKYVLIKGVTVKAIEYKGGSRGDDIYVTVTKDDVDYSFCIEKYLTDENTDVYKAVEALTAGDVIDVQGFLYWYEGVNTHITKVTKK